MFHNLTAVELLDPIYLLLGWKAHHGQHGVKAIPQSLDRATEFIASVLHLWRGVVQR